MHMRLVVSWWCHTFEQLRGWDGPKCRQAWMALKWHPLRQDMWGNDGPSKGGIDGLVERIKGPARRKNKVEYAGGRGRR
jgi:hypothetical protein